VLAAVLADDAVLWPVRCATCVRAVVRTLALVVRTLSGAARHAMHCFMLVFCVNARSASSAAATARWLTSSSPPRSSGARHAVRPREGGCAACPSTAALPYRRCRAAHRCRALLGIYVRRVLWVVLLYYMQYTVYLLTLALTASLPAPPPHALSFSAPAPIPRCARARTLRAPWCAVSHPAPRAPCATPYAPRIVTSSLNAVFTITSGD
jgi:hypothetical protein